MPEQITFTPLKADEGRHCVECGELLGELGQWGVDDDLCVHNDCLRRVMMGPEDYDRWFWQ